MGADRVVNFERNSFYIKMNEAHYKEFSQKVDTAIASFLLWNTIQVKSTDPVMLRAFNCSGLSWSIIRHSCQVTFIVTLGSIFDEDEDSLSADGFLTDCIENIDAFSRDNLKVRKMDTFDGQPNELDEFLSNAYIPEEKDFQRLRGRTFQNKKNI